MLLLLLLLHECPASLCCCMPARPLPPCLLLGVGCPLHLLPLLLPLKMLQERCCPLLHQPQCLLLRVLLVHELQRLGELPHMLAAS